MKKDIQKVTLAIDRGSRNTRKSFPSYVQEGEFSRYFKSPLEINCKYQFMGMFTFSISAYLARISSACSLVSDVVGLDDRGERNPGSFKPSDCFDAI